jgi:hypothetical protein
MNMDNNTKAKKMADALEAVSDGGPASGAIRTPPILLMKMKGEGRAGRQSRPPTTSS